MSCVNTDRRQPSLARVAVAAGGDARAGRRTFSNLRYRRRSQRASSARDPDPRSFLAPVFGLLGGVAGDERKAVTDLFVIVHFPPFSDCFLVMEHISLTFRERKTSIRVQPNDQSTTVRAVAMAGLAQKLPLPVVALGGVVVGVLALLKLKRLVGGDDFADSQAKYRRCNRCAKKGAKVRCTRCRRAYYCSRACLKAAWKLEICECC